MSISRCRLRAVREDGTEADTLACCRIADHPGDDGTGCHFHFAGRMPARPHTVWVRGTSRAVECSAGRDLDVAAGLDVLLTVTPTP